MWGSSSPPDGGRAPIPAEWLSTLQDPPAISGSSRGTWHLAVPSIPEAFQATKNILSLPVPSTAASEVLCSWGKPALGPFQRSPSMWHCFPPQGVPPQHTPEHRHQSPAEGLACLPEFPALVPGLQAAFLGLEASIASGLVQTRRGVALVHRALVPETPKLLSHLMHHSGELTRQSPSPECQHGSPRAHLRSQTRRSTRHHSMG